MSERPGSGSRPRHRSTVLEDGGVSLFELIRIIIASRARIILWTVIGGAIAVGPVLFQPLEYTASASFYPQGSGNSSSALATLAGQFGLNTATSEPEQSTDFYSDLLRSREILGPIVDGAIRIRDRGDSLVSMLDLFEVSEIDPEIARVEGIEALSEALAISVSPTTGVLRMSIATRWPEVSLEIAERLVASVNTFNLEARQSRAAAEGRFLQTRLQEANDSVAGAEGRLGVFLRNNRQFTSSPDLSFEFDRLQRRVVHHQGILTALATSFEDARVRAVRNTPVITVIEAPELPARPDPRGRTQRGLLGMLFGGMVGAALGFFKEALQRRDLEGDPELEALMAVVRQAKHDLLGLIPGWRRPS